MSDKDMLISLIAYLAVMGFLYIVINPFDERRPSFFIPLVFGAGTVGMVYGRYDARDVDNTLNALLHMFIAGMAGLLIGSIGIGIGWLVGAIFRAQVIGI